MFVKLNSGRVTMETGLNKEQEEALKCVFEIFDEDGRPVLTPCVITGLQRLMGAWQREQKMSYVLGKRKDTAVLRL